MSISSWLRMWQCHTYSQPKLATSLTIGAIGLPLASVLLNPASVPVGAVLRSPGADGHHRVERTLAVGDAERERRHDRPHRHDGVLERADPDGVLPAELVRVGRDDDVVPGDPVEHLHVEQVEVDRVRVHPVVGDLPDLGPVGGRGDRGHVQAARHPGRVQDLGRRVHERVQDDVLQQRRGARRLQAQVGGHPAALVEVGRVHLVMDALGLRTGSPVAVAAARVSNLKTVACPAR